MEFIKLLMLAISSVSLVLNYNVVAVDAINSPTCKFSAIYNFGGSNSDTGGLSAAFYPVPSPNGRTFFKKPAGRISDGRLIIDFIAEHLKLPYLSSYLNSVEANYKHGANFAIIGATINSWPEPFWVNGVSPYIVKAQIGLHFDQFKNRSINLYNQGKDRSRLPKPEDFSKALYTIDLGNDDLAFGFRTMSDDEFRAQIPTIVQLLAESVQLLYQKGARTFWIQGSGAVGCLPNTTISISKPEAGYLDKNGCVKSQNEVAKELNKQVKEEVIKLRTELQDAAITYVDLYTAEYDLITNAKNQGFTDPMTICCGIHEPGAYVECGKEGIIKGKKIHAAAACKNPSTFISWDGLHHTEAANRWIANRIIKGSLSDPPLPISLACHRT